MILGARTPDGRDGYRGDAVRSDHRRMSVDEPSSDDANLITRLSRSTDARCMCGSPS
jgi:hypothetical protein